MPTIRIRLALLAFISFILLILAGSFLSKGARFSPVSAAPHAPLAIMRDRNHSPAEPVLLTDAQGEYPLGLHLEILEDPGAKLTIAEVSSPAYEARFVPSQVDVPNFGFTTSAYWVRVRLINHTRATNEWLLKIGYVNTQYVDLYTPQPDDAGYSVKQTGFLRPPSTRDILYPKIVFALNVPAGSQQTYYLRFKSDASMTLPLTLWKEDAFLRHSQPDFMIHWLFFGSILALMVYHLFLLISLPEANYLYYALLLTSLFAFFSAYEGYLGVYIFPQLYAIQFYAPLAYVAMFTCLTLFSDSFLELKTRHPKLHRIHLGFVVSGFVLMLLAVFASYHIMVILAIPWGLLCLAFIWASGIVSWRKGFSPARLFMVAWLGMIASLFLLLLVRSGIVPSSPLTERIYQPGLLLMAIGWAIALANRIKLLKNETESANRNLRNSENRLSQILDGIPLGVMMYGHDQRLKYFNKRVTEILSNPEKGILPEIWANRSLNQAIDYYTLRVAGTNVRYPVEKLPIYSALNGSPASRDDLEVNFGDRSISIELWASPVRNEVGIVEFAIAAFQDVTQRKQAEAQLAEYHRRLEALVANRTAELQTRLEWLSAVNLVNQTITRLPNYWQIYEEIVGIVNHLFPSQDVFIAGLEENGEKICILAHSCPAPERQELVGSYANLPQGIRFAAGLERDGFASLSSEQMKMLDGPLGQHIQETGLGGIVLVPLRARDQLFGFLGLEMETKGRAINSEEANLLEIFSTDVAQIMENARLFEQAKLLAATEERNRLARELHDSITQSLYSIKLYANASRLALEARKLEVASKNLGELEKLTRQIMSDMRLLIYELRPPALQQEGLQAALQRRLDSVETRAGFQAKLEVEGTFQFSKEQESELYRIAQEALNNVVKHAQADRVKIRLVGEASRFRMIIEDDGVGFDPDTAGQDGGQGLRNIKERAEKIGATFDISSSPGQGVRIVIEMDRYQP